MFWIPDTQQVDVRVRDMQGRTTQVIVSKLLPSGLQQWYWNGRDDYGVPVHDALYWVTVESGNDKRAQLLFRN
jgi:flagellar hook assembly protein FlgD